MARPLQTPPWEAVGARPPGREARMQETGRVGLVVVGLGGVGSSLLTGVLAARAHLVHPFGSLIEAGGSGRPKGLSPLRERAPFAELSDLTLGAFELREDDGYRAALRAGLVSRS